jgi:hypothetical protein
MCGIFDGLNMKKLLIFTILLMAILVSTTFAQSEDVGKLNVWTLSTVARQNDSNDGATYLKEVRAAKNSGFDRVVFEFTGGLPAYFKVEFVKASDLVSPGEEVIKVKGKYFVGVFLRSQPYPEPEENIADAKFPKGNLKLPIFNEIKEIEWFEGYREFGIGLNAKKNFRVTQLRNPSRLVIDFKQ